MGCAPSGKVSVPNLEVGEDTSQRSSSPLTDKTSEESGARPESSTEEKSNKEDSTADQFANQTDSLVQDTLNRLPLPPIKHLNPPENPPPSPSHLPNANLPPLKLPIEDEGVLEAAVSGLQEKAKQKCVRIAEGFSLIPQEPLEDHHP